MEIKWKHKILKVEEAERIKKNLLWHPPAKQPLNPNTLYLIIPIQTL